MADKLAFIEDKFKELEMKMMDPDLINRDIQEWQRVMKEHSDLEPIVIKYRALNEAETGLEESKAMLQEKLDDEMKELVREEIKTLEEDVEKFREEIKVLLIPKDPNDHKNVIVEIRAGAGGDEAALFAGTLFRMYVRYAERNNWKVDIMNTNEIQPENHSTRIEYPLSQVSQAGSTLMPLLSFSSPLKP